jgi:hypothetical protein
VRIEFNNLEELDDFIGWVRNGRAAEHSRLTNAVPAASTVRVSDERSSAGLDIAKVRHDDGSVTTTSIGVPPDVAPDEITPADKPKRARRTKAEMEAARAAELAAQTGATEPVLAEPQAAPSEPANEPENAAAANGNPFSNGTKMIEAALVAPDAASATRAVGEALRAESARPDTAGATDAAAWIAAKEQELIKVDAIECLRLSRNFIAKHGFQNYQRVFALTGLPAEITKYKEAERLQHAATMAFLAEHPDA